ncbi:MAG: hypothetical protein Q8M22_16600 [Actinomycetota bacterium]|nr:hypothetical protein [Actinomycetota bacterium]
MWPHVLTIAVGDTVVVVGTDDDPLAALLQPMRVPSDEHAPDTAARIDFGVELHPPRPAHRAAPRSLPTFQHGSRVIGRAGDVDALRDGVLRTLASLAVPVPAGQVRLTGLPLLHADGVELAPPAAATVAHRRLTTRARRPLYVSSVRVDPTTLLATIDAPLGAATDPLVVPLRTWWLDGDGVEAAQPATLGRLVALAAHRTVDPLRGPERHSMQLAALVQLVDRLPPAEGRFGT